MLRSTNVLAISLMILMLGMVGTAYAADYDTYMTRVWNYDIYGTEWVDIQVDGNVYGTSGDQDVYVTGSMSGSYGGGWTNTAPISLKYSGYTAGSTLSWYEARCSAGIDRDCVNIQTGTSYVRFISPENDTTFYVGFNGTTGTMQVKAYEDLIGAYANCQSTNCNISDNDTASVTY